MAAADSDLTQEELEAQLEAFMRRQAEIESGSAARKVEPGKVLGADEVSDEVRRCFTDCFGKCVSGADAGWARAGAVETLACRLSALERCCALQPAALMWRAAGNVAFPADFRA